jgi:hypothetical protein
MVDEKIEQCFENAPQHLVEISHKSLTFPGWQKTHGISIAGFNVLLILFDSATNSPEKPKDQQYKEKITKIEATLKDRPKKICYEISDDGSMMFLGLEGTPSLIRSCPPNDKGF